jgi:PAS domain S-box-containing protein
VKTDILAGSKAAWETPRELTQELAIIEQLFDHVPETAFFLKDSHGRYLAVNQSLVERCGVQTKTDLIGRQPRDVYPSELGRLYETQDQTVLRTGRPIIDHLEMHWYAHRQSGWCLTTKLPMRDEAGRIFGVVGVSRDLRSPGFLAMIPASLASTLEFLETHCAERISPHSLARRAGMAPVRFARLIKRIFRLSPSQLIMQTRIAQAARLLAETDRPIAGIAQSCGFYDQSAMTRAFRSVINLTPTQFRGLKKG